MTLRDRILAVYRDDEPDRVPFMLDLSHWFYHREGLPWDLSRAYEVPEYALIDYHRRIGAGFYMPNLASFFDVTFPPHVKARVSKSPDGREITWAFDTPLGSIQRTRRWEDVTYAWGIAGWGLRTETDLRVLACALEARTYLPRWDRYKAWAEYVGQQGLVYLPFGYSAMGQLLNCWLGIEGTVFAIADSPGTVRDVVDRINANNLACIDVLAASPAEVVIMGDNFSSDVQPPEFFNRWSRGFYAEAIRRLHAAGKFVAVHIDGRLRGALRMIRDVGADCADAVTPAPMGDLTPAECRQEGGPHFVLSGGVSPEVWLPNVSVGKFKQAVRDWLALRRTGRLIAAAGDQVPPGAPEERIEIMRDLVER